MPSDKKIFFVTINTTTKQNQKFTKTPENLRANQNIKIFNMQKTSKHQK
jgi:hypothetical protein